MYHWKPLDQTITEMIAKNKTSTNMLFALISIENKRNRELIITNSLLQGCTEKVQNHETDEEIELKVLISQLQYKKKMIERDLVLIRRKKEKEIENLHNP